MSSGSLFSSSFVSCHSHFLLPLIFIWSLFISTFSSKSGLFFLSFFPFLFLLVFPFSLLFSSYILVFPIFPFFLSIFFISFSLFLFFSRLFSCHHPFLFVHAFPPFPVHALLFYPLFFLCSLVFLTFFLFIPAFLLFSSYVLVFPSFLFLCFSLYFFSPTSCVSVFTSFPLLAML